MRYARKSKYGVSAPEARTADGIQFHSRKEMLAYQNFKLLLDNGKIGKLELQVPFVLWAHQGNWNKTEHGQPVPVAKYVADMVITNLDGSREIFDVKGMKTAMYRLKSKWFTACYPNLRIVEI